jgi:hypothetical protein
MSKFTSDIARAVREEILDPEFVARRYGRIFWVKQSSDVDYTTFVAEHPAYENAVPAVYTTIQAAVTAANDRDVVLVTVPDMAAGACDPTSYTENVVIAAGKSGISIIGIPSNRTQGGLPQLKKSAADSPLLTVRAPGCTIKNMGFNGAGATAGGILLDDDASTKSAFGTIVENCHFKNLKGSGNASTGGAIYWSSLGGAWQILVKDCHFYNCRAGVVLTGTGSSRPQDVVIDNCTFLASANTTVDADIYLAGGSGVDGLIIRNCEFAVVDVPAYASSPAAARYLDLTGCTNGLMVGCRFACTGKTFGAAGNAAKIPTTVRMAECHQEDAIITRT